MNRGLTGVAAAAVLACVVLTAASSAGAAPAPLAGTATFAADFYPCAENIQGPPPVSSCTRTTPIVSATCDPGGESTISITRDGFVSTGGTYTETITATLGPQAAPPTPEFQPFSFTGLQVGSALLPTGRIDSWDDHFTMSLADGSTVTGTKTLVDDLANSGVCRTFQDQVTTSPYLGGASAPVTGFVFLLNAGSLAYGADITDGSGTTHDTGVAEAYLGDGLVTCCDSSNPTQVNLAEGNLIQSYGTNHPFSGTSTSAPISGTSVSPAPGVSLDFSSVSTGGTASVTMLQPTDVAALPPGYLVGDPPLFYDITVQGTTYSGAITVCAPAGIGPDGSTPRLLHYENGAWVDVTSTYDGLTHTVCGVVTSLSPFAAVFTPAAPRTKDDCKNGGWQRYTSPRFRNQGDCVSWVATKGKNPPRG